jgi:hypothetical protein
MDMMSVRKAIRRWKHTKRLKKELEEWIDKGRPGPSPRLLKQQTLKSYAESYHLKIFVETGTFRGEMVQAMEGVFTKIYSIELSKELYDEAKKRFKNQKHIELVHGDSGKELKKVMQKVDKPALFWLDGHYSGGKTAKGIKDTPIYEELTHILHMKDFGHVILIDDACRFGTDPAYPTTEELKDFIRTKCEEALISVEDDIIRVVCKSAAMNG